MDRVRPKISIIVPIYNVAAYLDHTLYSVVNQTLKDIEIICVNDCSTDRSQDILDRFLAEDDRIKLIKNTENIGVGLSRKKAIEYATGEYIMFLDGDDYLDVSACKKLYYTMQKQPVDIIQFRTHIVPMCDVNDAEVRNLKEWLLPYMGELEARIQGEMVDFCFNQKKFTPSLWNKIYRADVVKYAARYYADERFNISEDLYLFYLIAFFAKSYYGIDEESYNYRFGAGITGGMRELSEQRFADKMKQGNILKLLAAFSDQHDSVAITTMALEQIKNTFARDVVYNWIHDGRHLNGIKYVLDYFDGSELFSVLIEMLEECAYVEKKEILDQLRQVPFPVASKTKIKTIGTIYFRMNNGGIERVISKLIPIWSNLGYHIILFTDEFSNSEDYQYGENITRIVLPNIADVTSKSIRNRMVYLAKMLQRYNVDILIYHAWVWKGLLADMLSAKLAGVKFVVHTHSFFGQGEGSCIAKDACHSIQLTQLYALCDGIICLSEVDKKWWEIFHPHVYKMRNPITFALDDITPNRITDNKNILWIGRISREKQPIDALKIIRQVVDKDARVKLHIVGRADDKEFYEEFTNAIAAYKLDANVQLHGFQSDVAGFYKNADICICTSEYEGFLMTLAESKAYGIPVVMYDLPNLDLAQQRKGTVVVPQSDVNAAALAIIELLNNPMKRELIAKEARQSIEFFYETPIENDWAQFFNDFSEEHITSQYIVDADLKTGLSMLQDFCARGIEEREKDRLWWMRQVVEAQPLSYAKDAMKDEMLAMYRNGDIGFKYIIKYMIAWLKYKIKGSN